MSPVSKSANRKAKQTSAITTTTVDETAAASSGNQKDNTVLHFQQQKHAAVAEKAVSKSNSILQLMQRYWFKMHNSTPAALRLVGRTAIGSKIMLVPLLCSIQY
jgi:hypothetical protein